MKRWFFIFLAFAVYLLFCSKSCDSGNMDDAAMQKKELKKTKNLIRYQAESEILSDQSLRAYEASARQKLYDFADYLTLYYDKNLDSAMKAQAGNMIVKLFSAKEIKIPTIITGVKSAENSTLNDMLSYDNLPEYDDIKITIDSAVVIKPLSYSGESKYRGELSFCTRVISYSASDSLISESVKMEVEILVKKVNKTFGSESLRVWGVFLGNMKFSATDQP